MTVTQARYVKDAFVLSLCEIVVMETAVTRNKSDIKTGAIFLTVVVIFIVCNLL